MISFFHWTRSKKILSFKFTKKIQHDFFFHFLISCWSRLDLFWFNPFSSSGHFRPDLLQFLTHQKLVREMNYIAGNILSEMTINSKFKEIHMAYFNTMITWTWFWPRIGLTQSLRLWIRPNHQFVRITNGLKRRYSASRTYTCMTCHGNHDLENEVQSKIVFHTYMFHIQV